ncbi:MAG: lytic transglycosylase domain-containing protein [Elusimicrobiales bacterium]|jgi:soluble lytic murein transglycosylase-like protein
MRIALVLAEAAVIANWTPVMAQVRSFDELSALDSAAAGRNADLPQPRSAERTADPGDQGDDMSEDPLTEALSFKVFQETGQSPAEPGLLEASYSKSRIGGPNVPYLDEITKEASAQRVDLELVLALIHKESAFDAGLTSTDGAIGLMQIMPDTAKKLGLKNAKEALYDPEINLKYGIGYLRYLFGHYGVDDYAALEAEDILRKDILKAVAAYNAGEGAVDRWHGVPPYPETKSFVKKVAKYFKHYKKLAAKKTRAV